MKTMRDNLGKDIPIKYVKEYDRKRDEKARKVLARFLKAKKMLESVVVDTLADADAVLLARDKEIGERGNFQFRSFDGLIEIEIRQDYRIVMDDRVAKAKQMMLEYARELCAKAGDDAQALFEILDEAFEAKRGSLSNARVLSLVNRKITGKKWQEARQLLIDSIQKERSRRYINVRTRSSVQQTKWDSVYLDLASCWPEEKEADK